ncbi:TetR/AcrR family transcriptional regulator [Spirillospora sp. CA-294931]|uniref:TetR/AcrR family transcriptional regulator n=1 Tax=Spirillospora sp. CA-294931 TaxID=3240042 RepID=UPI003D90A3EE
MTREDQILAAAIKHLNERPTASMAQIAEAIGVSRATLHRHYASREALLHALGVRALDQWEESQERARIDRAAASGDAETLTAALKTLIYALVEGAEEYGYALTDHFMYAMPDLVARGEALEEREIAFYAAAQRAGVLRADLPTRWISNLILGVMITVRDSLHRGEVARRDLEALAYTTFLHGTGGKS